MLPSRLLAMVLAVTLYCAPVALAAAESKEATWSWTNALLEPFVSLSHWVTGLFSSGEGFFANEIEQFKHTVDSDLSDFDDLVRQAGFQIGSISVVASLIPHIIMSMELVRWLSEAEKTALKAKITGTASTLGTIQRSIIITLLNAVESTYMIRNDGYRLTGVDIDIDLMPEVTFIMSKER